MDVLYVPNEAECEYVCENALNDNVYVYMAARPIGVDHHQPHLQPPLDARPVSYLEITGGKRENIYEYIDYAALQETEKKKQSQYLVCVKRTILFVFLLVALVGLVAFCYFMWTLIQSSSGSSKLSTDEDENEDEDDMITFALNITSTADRQSFVRNMTREAWNAYVEFAWGSGALKPLTKEADDSTTVGQTIVASMSTLWTMEMYAEFERGKQWIASELHALKDTPMEVPVFDIVVGYLGALLSCFALTGDVMFLNKSYEIANMLTPAFNFTAQTKIVRPLLDLKSGQLSGSSNYLAYLGHRQVEMLYLAQLTGERLFAEYINSVAAFVEQLPTHNGLYFEKYYLEQGGHSAISTLSLHARDFYYNLIRAYIQSNGNDVYSYQRYAEAILAVDSAELFGRSNRSGLIFAREMDIAEDVHKKWSSGTNCYLGAMLALGVEAITKHSAKMKQALGAGSRKYVKFKSIERQRQLAIALTETCHQAAIRTRTGLLPQRFIFTQHEEATTSLVTIGLLSPELAESYFILWRLTHNTKFREYAWQLTKAIYKHCRTESGYAPVQNVNRVPTIKNNVQLPSFLSGTLKYLYLTFSDETLLPLDSWVFTAAGHPLPVLANAKTKIRVNQVR